MADPINTTGDIKIQRAWFGNLLTPQFVVYFMGAVIAVVVFWTRTKESWDKVKELERSMTTKADQVEVKAVDDKVNKQYETNRQVADRIVALEKLVEFQRGYQKAVDDQKKQQQ